VLVIDDDPDVLALICAQLKPAGYRVMVGRGGSEALRMAVVEPPDVILCDLMMPDVDGITVIKKLRGDPRCTTIPVIFSTGSNDATTRRRIREITAIEPLIKPFSGNQLRAAVETSLAAKNPPVAKTGVVVS
jgi:CheY-like chemotaxis protein